MTAADQGAFHALTMGDGQFVFNKGAKLSAIIVSNNQIRISDGDIYMQGRYIRLNEGMYVDLTIENGVQGRFRNDLIVARYTKEAGTGIEDVNLVVIKGTAVASSPADPAYTVGNLLDGGDSLNDMPLYRVVLDGINIQQLVPLFDAATFAPLSMVGENKQRLDMLEAMHPVGADEFYAMAADLGAAVDSAMSTASAAMPKAGGQFTGTIRASSSYQSIGTALLRNSKLVSIDTTPTVNGEINWTYK